MSAVVTILVLFSAASLFVSLIAIAAAMLSSRMSRDEEEPELVQHMENWSGRGLEPRSLEQRQT